MGFRGFLNPRPRQLSPHLLQFFRLLLNRADGVEILIELLLVTVAELTSEVAGILQDEVRDITVGLDLLGPEQTPVGLSRVAQGGRHVPGPIPGNIIEVHGLLVVLVAVAAEFEGPERGVLPDRVSDDMVKTPVERVGRLSDLERTGTGEKAGGALRVHVSPRLEGPVHPGDQGDFLPHLLEGLHGGRQLKRTHSHRDLLYALRHLLAAPGKLRNSRCGLPGKEPAAHHPDRHIKPCNTLGGFRDGSFLSKALHPRQGQGGSTNTAQEGSS